jgi:predicted Zn finger-like uncharacterized protein
MAAVQLRCPECNATLRMSDEVLDGKKIRCPKCETVFRPSEDDLDESDSAMPRRRADRSDGRRHRSDAPDRPARSRSSRKPQKSNAPLIVGAAVIGILVLGGVVAVAAVYWPEKKNDQPAVANANNNNVGPPPSPPRPALPPVGAKTAAKVGGTGNGGTGIEIGQTAMEINGEDIDGQPFKLSDYRGKVVVLDFWGNW